MTTPVRPERLNLTDGGAVTGLDSVCLVPIDNGTAVCVGPRDHDDHLRARITRIPGGDGWWHSDGEDCYLQLAGQLVGRGFTEDEAVELLGAAFAAAAGEFGS